MRKHCNEYLKSGLANSGRIAGSGILHDRYDDESGAGTYTGSGTPVGISEREENAKREHENAPVTTYYMKSGEQI